MTNQLPLTLSTESSPDFTSDDWETPLTLAQKFIQIIADHLQRTKVKALEIGAGYGNITRYAPTNWEVTAVEPKYNRYLKGRDNAPRATWVNSRLEELNDLGKFDLIFGNPPFSKQAFHAVFTDCYQNRANENTLFALILPTTYWQTVGSYKLLRSSGLEIIAQYQIMNRVAFLKDGVARQGRQCYDAIHLLQKAGRTPGVNVIEQ